MVLIPQPLNMSGAIRRSTTAAARFKLLIGFVHARTGKTPSTLDWDDLGPETVCAFLDHIETERRNGPRTRNLRLTAIRSLFAYASLRHPEHAALIQRVLAVPPKRFEKPIVSFLTAEQVDALIDAPDRTRWEGRRDRTLLLVAVQTGLRISELTGLNCGDVTFGDGASVRCEGKGRKQRAVPLSRPCEAILKVWMNERAGRRDEPLFPTRTGRRLSADAVQRLVRKHAQVATSRCPSLRTCVRRRKRTTHFGIGGPVISAETDHPFRPKWTTLRLTAGRG